MAAYVKVLWKSLTTPDLETDLMTDLGFTLDDLETAEIYHPGEEWPYYERLDLVTIKTYLTPLTKVTRKYQGYIESYPYRLILVLKHGSDGENVGRRRQKYGDNICGQVTISLSLSKDGSSIYLTSPRSSYDYRYYSPDVSKLKAFLETTIQNK